MKTQNLMAGIVVIFLSSGYLLGQESGWREEGDVVHLREITDNVGIGTSSPATQLHTVGLIRASRPSYPDQYIEIHGTGGAYITASAGSDILLRIDETVVGRFNTTGFGIGVIPTERLHTVGGNVLFDTGTGGKLILRDTAPRMDWYDDNTGENLKYRQIGVNAQNMYFSRIDDDLSSNQVHQMVIDPNGNVGIGTTTPAAPLHVQGVGNAALTLQRDGQSEIVNMFTTGGFYFEANTSFIFRNLEGAGDDRFVIHCNGDVGIGTSSPGAKLDVNGTTRTKVIEITGGSDLAEPFEVAGTESIKPGMVVSIDPEQPGGLRVSSQAYDRTVAGIISGAGGVNPGILMTGSESEAVSAYPVALTGRVYAWADATEGPIRPGDLLTTSDTPGHAMKVSDYTNTQGTIIGKAMSSLEEGQGLVLVLVALQ